MRRLLLLFFLTPVLAQHVVAPGETLFSIARRYGLSVEELARLNGLQDPDRIHPGQVLRLSGEERRILPKGEVRLGGLWVGQATLVRVAGYKEGEVRAFGRTFPLALSQEGLLGYLGVPALEKPGVHRVEFFLEGGRFPFDLEVHPVSYPREVIPLTPGLKARMDPNTLREEREKVIASCRFRPGLPLQFRPPLEKMQITSPFGTRRRYGEGGWTYHEGMDLKAEVGVPVRTAAEGVVVLSEPLFVRGEAVVLDHGLGVCTGYWHLSARKVRLGERVKPGQVIGLVGSTGLSTGPHLHFEVRVAGLPVDPGGFLR